MSDLVFILNYELSRTTVRRTLASVAGSRVPELLIGNIKRWVGFFCQGFLQQHMQQLQTWDSAIVRIQNELFLESYVG